MKLAKIESVYRPNLLVNGDFQINQRGQTSYTSTDVQSSLTVDCWRIGGQATLTVNDDNVILSATGDGESYLAQHIDKDLTGKKLSVAVKVTNDKVYTGTITVTDVETVFISDGQWMTVSAKYDSNRKGTQIYINVKGGHSYSLEYADAFKGSIVYPHIPEDDATALLRCQEWVYGLITEDYARLPLGHLSSDMIQVPLPFVNLKSYTSVIMNGDFDVRCAYPDWWNISYRGSITEASFNYKSKMFQFKKPSLSGAPDSGQVFSVESQPGARIILSCEPL